MTIDNYLKSCAIPFSAVQEMKHSRLFITGGPRFGPARTVYVPSIVCRDGSVVKVGAGSGEDTAGPIHRALAQLGEQLGVPVHF